uniref:Uncharacterized protein n=1 Tax=viral metagenome TaxID=1070528 RepID=A0A6C0HST6_9ZZZZ
MSELEIGANCINILSFIALFFPTVLYRPNIITIIISLILGSQFGLLFLSSYKNLDKLVLLSYIVSYVFILLNCIYLCIVISSHKKRIEEQAVVNYENFMYVTFGIISLECIFLLLMLNSQNMKNVKNLQLYCAIEFFLLVGGVTITFYNNLSLTNYMAYG